MVARGNYHIHATVSVARGPIERTTTVLTRQQPYQMRDFDQAPVTMRAAQEVIASKDVVPEDVRECNVRTSPPPTEPSSLADSRG